jgi:hypothetical protein
MNERDSLFEFRSRMESETLRYAAERLRELADKAEERSAREAADREAAGGGDGLIPQSAAVPTSRAVADIKAAGAAWVTEAELERMCDAIVAAEVAASDAHDAVYAEDKQAASDAIWRIHDALRPLLPAEGKAPAWRMPGERYEDYIRRDRIERGRPGGVS